MLAVSCVWLQMRCPWHGGASATVTDGHVQHLIGPTGQLASPPRPHVVVSQGIIGLGNGIAVSLPWRGIATAGVRDKASGEGQWVVGGLMLCPGRNV